MRVRLAFAVAAHLEPEILLIDEVLAVGDAEFQKKCLGKMGDVARGGRTVLFVSHNMAAIQNLCERTLHLAAGARVSDGPTEKVIADYLGCREQPGVQLGKRSDREGNGWLRFTEISVQSDVGTSLDIVQSGALLDIRACYVTTRALQNPIFYIGIYDMFGVQLVHMNTHLAGYSLDGVDSSGSVVCRIPELPLPPGQYAINIAARAEEQMLDRVEHACTFTVEGGDFFGSGRIKSASAGKVLVKHSWSHAKQ